MTIYSTPNFSAATQRGDLWYWKTSGKTYKPNAAHHYTTLHPCKLKTLCEFPRPLSILNHPWPRFLWYTLLSCPYLLDVSLQLTSIQGIAEGLHLEGISHQRVVPAIVVPQGYNLTGHKRTISSQTNRSKPDAIRKNVCQIWVFKGRNSFERTWGVPGVPIWDEHLGDSRAHRFWANRLIHPTTLLRKWEKTRCKLNCCPWPGTTKL